MLMYALVILIFQYAWKHEMLSNKLIIENYALNTLSILKYYQVYVYSFKDVIPITAEIKGAVFL